MSEEGHVESSTPLWEIVPIEDFMPPSDSQLNVAHKKWQSLTNFFRIAEEPEKTHAKKEEVLRVLPTVQMQNLVPTVDWGDAATALDRFLVAQENNGRDSKIRFLIGQPHIDHGGILRQWAKPGKTAIQEGPDPAAILSGKWNMEKQWKPSESGWVIPELERWFLRHANGLWLVRELLEQAGSGLMGGGIIGCNSWAWAYLQRVWPLPNPTALTLRPFDGQSLARSVR